MCDRSNNSESGALTTTHQELVKQMQTAGILLSELAVPSYLPNPPAGKEKGSCLRPASRWQSPRRCLRSIT